MKQTERRRKKLSITIYKEENISPGKKTERVPREQDCLNEENFVYLNYSCAASAVQKMKYFTRSCF